MRGSSELHELYAALAEARMAFGVAARTKTATIKTEKASYTYRYAPLEACFAAIDEALGKVGLALTGGVEYTPEGQLVVITRLGHRSGQWIENGLLMGSPKTVRELGSMLTYGRRLGVCLTVQLQAEDDDDGEHDGGGLPEMKAQPQPASTRPAAAPVEAPPVVQEAQAVLGRKPIEKMNQQECVFRLQDELKRLVGTGQDPTSKQERTDLIMSVYGTAIDSFTKATTLGKSALQRGLVKLDAMRPDQPPAATIDEDVPDFPPPEGSSSLNPQEGISQGQGSTIDPGPSLDTPQTPNGQLGVDPDALCVVVEGGTGVRCVRPAQHTGAHYFSPPRPEARAQQPIRDEDITPPDAPTLVDGYCTVGDARVLRVWCAMHEQAQTYDEMVAFVPQVGGEPRISARLWEVIVGTVTLFAERAARG